MQGGSTDVSKSWHVLDALFFLSADGDVAVCGFRPAALSQDKQGR